MDLVIATIQSELLSTDGMQSHVLAMYTCRLFSLSARRRLNVPVPVFLSCLGIYAVGLFPLEASSVCAFQGCLGFIGVCMCVFERERKKNMVVRFNFEQ